MPKQLKSNRQARRQGLHQGNLRLAFARRAFQSLGSLFPQLCSRWAYALWARTHRYPEPGREKRMRLRAKEHSFLINNQKIKAWSWGDGPLVLLIHGWNGRGMQMSGFVDPLLKSGYRIMCFDAPGHGVSQGDSSSINEIRDVILHIGKHEGTVHAAIAHSFGVPCLSASLVDGFNCHTVVALSSPGDYQSLLDGYANHLRIPNTVKEFLKVRLITRIGQKLWDDFSPAMSAEELPKHCLIIHDADDKTVPWQIGEGLAKRWPNAEFLLTHGLGHRRLLLSAKLARQITTYIDETRYFEAV